MNKSTAPTQFHSSTCRIKKDRRFTSSGNRCLDDDDDDDDDYDDDDLEPNSTAQSNADTIHRPTKSLHAARKPTKSILDNGASMKALGAMIEEHFPSDKLGSC